MNDITLDHNIIKLVTNKEYFDLLVYFLARRIETHKDALTVADLDNVVRLQANIQELKFIKGLRETVEARKSNGR